MRALMSTSRSLMPCVVLGGLLATLACGSEEPPVIIPPPSPTVTSVTVAGGTTIIVGQTAQFSATANLSNNTTENVSASATWASSNTGVATVSGTGLAAGLAAGQTDIRATHQSVAGTASLQVNAPAPPPATGPPMARFTVSGPGGANVCRIIEDSGGDLDCTFDGSTSTAGGGGPITRWTWRYDVGKNSLGPINRDNIPTHTPQNLCGEFDEEVPQNGTAEFVQMIVKLEVRDASGTVSQEVRNTNVRLFPRKQCNFGF